MLFGLLFGQGQARSVGVQVRVFRYLGSMLVYLFFFGRLELILHNKVSPGLLAPQTAPLWIPF